MERIKHEENPEVVHVKSESGRELVYAGQFKKLIADNPGVLADFLKVQRKIGKKFETRNLSDGSIFKEGDIDVLAFIEDIDTGEKRYYTKVKMGEEKFFVKAVPGKEGTGKGAEEFISMQKAKEFLYEMAGKENAEDVKNVDVIDFQLGYQDKKGNTYFVSKWCEGERIDIFFNTCMDADSRETMRERLKKIRVVLEPHFKDVANCNMFYDEKTGKITIFDIHLGSDEEDDEKKDNALSDFIRDGQINNN